MSSDNNHESLPYQHRRLLNALQRHPMNLAAGTASLRLARVLERRGLITLEPNRAVGGYDARVVAKLEKRVVREQTRRVLLEVTTSSPKHCSNNCRFMETHRAGVCLLAGDYEAVELEWDARKKEHGFKRSSTCLGAEIKL